MPEVRRRRICAPRHGARAADAAEFSTAAAAIPIAISRSPHEPINEPCPKCGAAFIVEKRTKQGNFRACIKEGCDWEAEIQETPAAISAPPEPVGAGAPSLVK